MRDGEDREMERSDGRMDLSRSRTKRQEVRVEIQDDKKEKEIDLGDRTRGKEEKLRRM